MGQVFQPAPPPSIILSAVDRLVASNSDGGLSPTSQHIVLLGQAAGRNLAISEAYAIGWNSAGGAGAGLTDVQLNGTISIGANNLAVLNNIGTGGRADALSIVAIGRNVMPLENEGSSSVLIGDGVLQNWNPTVAGLDHTTRLVILGAQACGGMQSRNLYESVVIGHRAAYKTDVTLPLIGLTSSVVIGAFAAEDNKGNSVNNSDLATSVIIGAFAAQHIDTVGAGGGLVIIGSNCCNTFHGTRTIAIGQGMQMLGAGSNDNIGIGQNLILNGSGTVSIGTSNNVNGTEHVAIGNNQTANVTSSKSVLLGKNVACPASTRNILVGFGCGDSEPGANANRLIVETFDTGVRRGALYGDLNAGNLIAGLSTPGVNRDWRGTNQPTNALKLLDGGPGTGAGPTGGGFFYSLAGQLHWIDSAAVDQNLSLAASIGTFAVAALPAAPPILSRAYVNNALAPVFAAAPVAGGAILTPVYFNGATWQCG